MRGLTQQLVVSLRLYYRNTMALIYGYVFPVIFLIAFWVLYQYDRVPLVRHMGELLTIAVLGGACFGLPTTLVGERERGVWRRYRLTPVPTLHLVLSTVAARYAILITAGLLQVVLAMMIGMPAPAHPLDLFVAFTLVSFAFLGLGLVIAMLADTVLAVQALGQCIFLPMLIIGGVAVQLSALPEWAQVLSAYFPGRYAVEAIQASVNGDGLGSVGFSLLALLLIGAAGSLAASRMFRWDSQQRFTAIEGKAWLGVALAAWVAVGLTAQATGRVAPRPAGTTARVNVSAPVTASPTPALPDETAAGPPAPEPTPAQPAPAASPEPGPDAAQSGAPPDDLPSPPTPDGQDVPAEDQLPDEPQPVPAPPETAEPSSPEPSAAGVDATPPDEDGPPPAFPELGPPRWQDVTIAMIEQDIYFEGLPPDSGVVTPIASLMTEPDRELWEELDTLAFALPDWEPAKVSDPVQRVRNLLYVAAVPDIYQIPIESFVPAIVYAEIQESVPRDDLIKILYWIGIHPEGGDEAAIEALWELGLGSGPMDMIETRNRAAIYAVKLLGSLLDKRPMG